MELEKISCNIKLPRSAVQSARPKSSEDGHLYSCDGIIFPVTEQLTQL